MKFAVVVVLVALALGANSSIIPIGWPGSVVVDHHPGAISLDHSHLPVVVDHHPGAISLDHSHLPVVVGAPGSVAIQSAVHGVPHVVGSPVQIVTGPHVVPAVVPAVVPGGVAVSKTRGAVHVAPLPGHAQSVVQANLQPAPGTL